MNIQELLAKLAKGETLNEAESAFLATHIANQEEIATSSKALADKLAEEAKSKGDASNQTDDKGNKIPQSRLNEEIAKREDLKAQLSDLQTRLQDYEDRDLSEQEKATKAYQTQIDELSNKLATTTEELSTFKAQAEASDFELAVHKIAGTNATGNRFAHPDYLSLLLRSDKVDISDSEVLDTYMKGLQESKSEFFMTSVQPGSGANPEGNLGDGAPQSTKKIMEMNDSEKAEYHEQIGREAYDNQLVKELG